jgi:hypothetical protein
MGEAGVRFRCVTPAEAATVSKDSLEKKLTDFAVQLYNSKSLTLIEFRKYLDEAARKRLRNR